MIDLHCHLLPGIDDGAPDLATSLSMARIAAADGITVTACTPHIYPGLYENDAAGIFTAVEALKVSLSEAGIDLELTTGADTHLAPDLLANLRNGRIPTLAGSRYLLLEPPHHVAPPGFEQAMFQLLAEGFVPVLTHPERLSWIESHYGIFGRLVKSGAWMQVTAGSITGRFGRRPRYWAERMLDEGLVHIVATDAHGTDRRPPLLAEARDAVSLRLGEEEALRQVEHRPRCILEDRDPSFLPAPEAAAPATSTLTWSWRWGRA